MRGPMLKVRQVLPQAPVPTLCTQNLECLTIGIVRHEAMSTSHQTCLIFSTGTLTPCLLIYGAPPPSYLLILSLAISLHREQWEVQQALKSVRAVPQLPDQWHSSSYLHLAANSDQMGSVAPGN